MAQLILTEEEKAAISWLDLSDEDLGKYVRCNIARLATEQITADNTEILTKLVPFALSLLNIPHQFNATKLVILSEGCTNGNTKLGDWRIVLENVKEHKEE